MPGSILRRLALAATLVAAFAAIPDARAGDQCFCLAHKSGEIAHFGCDAREIPNRISKRVTCRKDDRSHETVSIDKPELFSRVEPDVGACNPCNPPLRTAPTDVIRQPGGLVGQ